MPDVDRRRSDDAVPLPLLDQVCCPSGSPRDDEKRGEELRGHPCLCVSAGGVEIGIGKQLSLVGHDVLDALRDGEQGWVAVWALAQPPRQVFEHCVAGVAAFVNAVSEAHNQLLCLQLLPQHCLRLLRAPEPLDEVHHSLVCPSMERPPQCSDGSAEGGECVRKRGCSHPRSKSGGRQVVLCVQDERGVHHLDVQEIGRLVGVLKHLEKGHRERILRVGVEGDADAAVVPVVPVQDHAAEGRHEPLPDPRRALQVLLRLQRPQHAAPRPQHVHGVRCRRHELQHLAQGRRQGPQAR
mmetsp:Transcript_5303/g.14954  ORF Transcript_5303/g.14954 Transcript_5303/m.14954 type:complete len:296 (+) Transcript_5303:660-1547(+)